MSTGESYYFRLGYDVFGPLVVGFSGWLLRESREYRAEAIAFCARDGYILKDAFDLLYPDCEIPTKYLYVSRASTLPTRILAQKNFSDVLDNAHLRKLTSPALLASRFNLSHERALELAKRCGVDVSSPVPAGRYYADNSAYRRFAELLVKEYRMSAAEGSGLFSRYLDEVGTGTRAVIVDVGWNGSTQAAMELANKGRRTTTEYLGCYLAANKSERLYDSNLKVEGYLYDEGHPFSDWFHVMESMGLLEFFLGAPHGTTLGYQIVDDVVVPVLGEFEFDDSSEGRRTKEALEQMHQGCLAYVRAHCSSKVPCVENAAHELIEVCSDPSDEDLYMLGDLLFFEGKASRLASPRPVREYLRSPWLLASEFGASTWKLGFLCRMLRSRALARTIYRFLLRMKR
ncbi:hypothetical protein [Thermophilibacter sp.]